MLQEEDYSSIVHQLSDFDDLNKVYDTYEAVHPPILYQYKRRAQKHWGIKKSDLAHECWDSLGLLYEE